MNSFGSAGKALKQKEMVVMKVEKVKDKSPNPV